MTRPLPSTSWPRVSRTLVAALLSAALLAGCSDDQGSDDPGSDDPASGPGDAGTSTDAAPASPVERAAECPEPPDLTGTFDPGATDGETSAYSTGSAAFTVTTEDGSTSCVEVDGVYAGEYDGEYGGATFDPTEADASAHLGDVDSGLVVSARPPRESFPTGPVELEMPAYFVAFQVDRTYYVGNADCVVTVSALSAERVAGTFDCGPISGNSGGPFDGTSEGPEAKRIKAASGWFTAAA